MKGSKVSYLWALLVGLIFMLAAPAGAYAQDNQPESEAQPLVIYTSYPSQMIGFGEVVTVPMKIKGGTAQTVSLKVEGLPDGWTATFRGGAHIVQSVYIDGMNEGSLDLRLEPAENAEAGEYELTVVATGDGERAEFPLTFIIEEKLPPRLALSIDGSPVKRGTPSGTFTFNVELRNDGGEDLTALLSAEEPLNFQVTIESGGQEVTEIQLNANETKNLTVKAEPLIQVEAGKYPFAVRAQAGDVMAELELTAEVAGEGNLRISTPDGRLSGQATVGEETPLKIVLRNDGTAPLRGIELTSSEPTGWSVAFDQTQFAEIPAGEQVEITARIQPAEKAIAGDYVVTINARPLDSRMESADFRITVKTSTLWGVAGIGLIAVAVSTVGLAVIRFGRR